MADPDNPDHHGRLRPVLLRAQELLAGHAGAHGRIRDLEHEFRMDHLRRVARLRLLALHQRLCGRPHQGTHRHGPGPAAVRRRQLRLRLRHRLQRLDHGRRERPETGRDPRVGHGRGHHPQPVFPGHGLPALRTDPPPLDPPLGTGYQDVGMELLPLDRRRPGRHRLRLPDGLARNEPQCRRRSRRTHHGQPGRQRRGQRRGTGTRVCRTRRSLEMVLLDPGLPGRGRRRHGLRRAAR